MTRSPCDTTAGLDDLARTVLSAYDLPVTALATIAEGTGATVEVRTDRNRYVLRLHRPDYRTVAQTTSELIFVEHLHEMLANSGVTVPRVVVAGDGRRVVEVDTDAGPRHCDVLTWLDGAPLYPGSGLDDPAVAALGRGLALLHNASGRFTPSGDFDLPHWDADGMFRPEHSPFRPILGLDELLSAEDRRLFDEIADRTRSVFTALDDQAGSYGVLHVDYILGNCHLIQRQDGWDVDVFDFADSGWGYYLYDLCPPLGNLAGLPGAVPDNPDFGRLRRIFLDAYRAERDLPAQVDDWLPVLMAARNANHCLWSAGRNLSPTPVRDAAWRMELARKCLALTS